MMKPPVIFITVRTYDMHCDTVLRPAKQDGFNFQYCPSTTKQ